MVAVESTPEMVDGVYATLAKNQAVVRRRLGNAVVRNRLKRRLRHICRNRPFLPHNLVILCQPPAVEAPFADLERELDYLVPKLSST